MARTVRPSRARTAGAPLARPLAVACARALDAKVGEDIVVLDVRALTGVTDFAVIATGTSAPHLDALTGGAEEALRKHGGRLHHREGGPGTPWILLDCGSIIVHLFDRETRRFYDLERLWADAKRVAWTPRPVPPPKKGRR